jgi:hypothetical protein
MNTASIHRSHLITTAFAALALGVLVPAARAANITWTNPQAISQTSDVLLTGSLVGAYYFTEFDNLTPLSLNGVSFTPVQVSGNTVSAGNFTLNGSANAGSLVTESFVDPYTSLPSTYQGILAGGMSGSSITMTIAGLLSGQSYRFEFWSSYSSDGTGGEYDTKATAGNAVSLYSSLPDDDGGLGQFTVGTFLATGTTQTITFTGVTSQALINAFQLRVVPEPASGMLFGTASLGLLLRRRRRK